MKVVVNPPSGREDVRSLAKLPDLISADFWREMLGKGLDQSVVTTTCPSGLIAPLRLIQLSHEDDAWMC